MKVGVGEVKAEKGVIRVKIVCEQGDIRVEFSGDFMVYPEDVIFELEELLSGPLRELGFYEETISRALESATLLGCRVSDFLDAFRIAYQGVGAAC